MALIDCPECRQQISDKALACPNCGYPNRQQIACSWRSFGFEWKSKQEFLGWPLVHVTIGFNKKTGRLAVSRGIIAIGQFGRGIITIAQFGYGVFGIGQFILGAVTISQFGIGIASLAQFCFALVAIAQMAIVVVAGKGQFVVNLSQVLQWIR